MAVSKVTTQKVSVETPQAPAASPKAAAAPAPRVILVNKCSTYVTPEREIFYARDSEGNTRVYEVPPKDLGRLLGYKDDFGRRFFKQTNAEGTGEEIGTVAKPAPLKRKDVEADNAPNNDDERGDGDEDELIDTGAMRLKDEDGNAVGVTV